MGLWKAIKNYDGTSNFYKYSDIYVTSEFKRGLSDINSNFILPHRLRVNKEFLKSNNMSNFYVSSLSHIDANYEKSLESNFNIKCHLESPETMYEILHMLTSKERNYFTYRYNVYTCKIQRTNKEVAQLMCVSEETARKEIIRITKIVLEILQNIQDEYKIDSQ
jgi:transposase